MNGIYGTASDLNKNILKNILNYRNKCTKSNIGDVICVISKFGQNFKIEIPEISLASILDFTYLTHPITYFLTHYLWTRTSE